MADAGRINLSNEVSGEVSRDVSGDEHQALIRQRSSNVGMSADKKKKIKYAIIGAGVLVVVVLAIVLPIVLTKSGGDNPNPPPDPPGPPVPPFSGQTLYNPYFIDQVADGESKIKGTMKAREPYKPEEHVSALRHLTSFLEDDKKPDPWNITTLPHEFPIGENNKFIPNLTYEFFLQDYNTGVFTITDADSSRFTIDHTVVNKAWYDENMRMEMLGFKLYTDPFSFQYTDVRDSSNWYLHTNDSSLVFMDKFIQMDFQLPSQKIFGFGERVHQFQLNEGTWTMWAKGQNAPYDDGLGGKNAYGVHPFILVESRRPGDFFGLFFRNANAQSPIIKYNQTTGGSTLSYITTGGQIEVYVFMHGSAKSVIQAYIQTIGTPNLPPFWAMGWHQSSYAYNDQNDIETMLQKYKANNFPLDTIWLDIPYLDNYADFAVNKTAFPDLPGLVKNLHDQYKRLMVINDAGISADDKTNKYYRMAYLNDALIKSAQYPDNEFHGAIVQKVWPNHTVFLDWFSPEAQEIWHTGLYDLYQQVPFDGLWLDMNEPTGFCSGECYDATPKPPPKEPEDHVDARISWYKSFTNQSQESTYYLPFIPGFNYGGNLDNMTLSLNATHKNGNTQYNVHNFFGHMMCENTYSFLRNDKLFSHADNRPFILTRSTFVGTGKYAAHWTGDNFREWKYMNYSVAGIMNMQMFGIPMVGSDVCGFFGPGELDSEMCARWIQLASFYPFARLHYSNDSTPSEPYNLKDEWQDVARRSMLDRYQYLRLMYTCMFEASKWGTTCFDPLFYHYPTDSNTYQNYEESFIVANALKISPILVDGVNENDGFVTYFPKGKWVSLTDFTVVDASDKGLHISLKPQKTVQVHLQPGAIIPFQNNSDHRINSTHQLHEKPITIIANLDEQGSAEGALFIDSGISMQELKEQHYEYYRLTIQAKTLQKQLAEGQHASQKTHYLDKVVITNAKGHNMQDVNFACYFTHHFDIVKMNTWYDQDTDVLHMWTDEHISFSEFRQINFGSTIQGDLNLCDPLSYQYKLKNGKMPDLSSNNVTLVLENMGKSGKDLSITLQSIDSRMLNVKWTFAQPMSDYTPFEVPKDIINVQKSSTMYPLSNFIKITDQPFGIQIINPKSGKTIIDLNEMLLGKYLNHYSQKLYTKKDDQFKGVMGLGERVSGELFYDDGVYSIWNRDAGMPFDDGRPAGKNVYGTHPFMMFEHDTNLWVGAFTNLANAQDWYIHNDKYAGTVQTTLVAAGGLADIYYMIDDNPSGVLTQYQKIIGKPVTIPQWALGWHQCRWGYKTTEYLENVVKGYKDSNIPLDTIWSDIDYMVNYRDFTYDKERFEDLPEFIDTLHENNMHYVPIIDAGISARSPGEYDVYDSGVEKDIFVKVNKEALIGKVWPKDAAYPDFFHPDASQWWQDQLTNMHNEVEFDGVWLDMNEASNFCNGICYQDQKLTKQVKYNMKYTPTGRDLETKSMPLDAEHYGGFKEVDTHSLFGTMEVKATHDWFLNRKNRTFIIERSSFAGMGKFGSRWLGDNEAQPWYMGGSVTGIMMMNMFGIPMAGSDICGFGGNTYPELCARWHIVGAFQPFSRNHNAWDSFDQEPYIDLFQQEYEPGVTYTDIMRMAIRSKYHLIKYYYTQLYTLSQDGGRPFYNPLFIEFPNDMNAYKDVKYNVMIGPALKLSHLSDSNGPDNTFLNQTQFYFPRGIWCNIYDFTEKCFTSQGEFQTRRTKAYDFYVHLREGYIIPMQNATKLNVNTTFQLQQSPVDFHILGSTIPYPGVEWSSQGTFINDDGLTLDFEDANRYNLEASYSTEGGQCKLFIKFDTKAKSNGCVKHNQNDILGTVILHNAQDSKVNGSFVVFAYYKLEDYEQIGMANYNAEFDKLIFTPKKEICMTELLYIKMVKTDCVV